MAERIIRGAGDPALFRVAKEVNVINPGVIRLLDDLVETMRAHQGLGLAAPQVGIAKRIIVAEYENALYEMINPLLIGEEGEVVDIEGCLSYPGIWAEVSRPQSVLIRAMDREGQVIEVHAEGIMARALRHEMDHLDGQVFVDKVIRFIDPSELDDGDKPATIRAIIEYRRGEK
ncbi:MAG: peptide deformylase [Symbiobacteriaceae bacterium]|nr:peptide deformylase [Symbiobacteriaceae bacterium]